MANDINRSIKIYIDSTEAGKSIEGLQEQIQKLEKELNSLNAEDPKQAARAKELKKALEDSNKTLNTYKNSVAETDRVLHNLSGATYKELIAVKQRMTQELQKTTRGTAEYNMKLEMLKRVSKEAALAQKDMRVEVGCQASSWGRAADFINKYMGLIGSAVAGITGITMAFGKLRDERDKLEASSANTKALTGLGDEDVQKLEDTAKRLSTTVTKEGVRIKQSAVEISDSFAVIGSQRPELLKSAEALEQVTQDAIYLSIAGKDKLEPAAKALTTVMNQMNLGADQSRRIINAIAAGSQAGAGNIQYITDAFEKSGTSANLMNIQLEQHIGLIEAVAPKYAEASMAGNSLDKVLLKMKEKNIGYKDGAFDLSRAIDEMATRFKKGESAASLFGVEHAKMAEILVMNKADIIKYTEAVTGTNKAVEQANINSDINEVKRAQTRNKMNLLGIELMEKLNPAITGVMNQTVHWTGKLVTAADWISKNSKLIVITVSSLAIYTAAIKLNSYWRTVSNGATMKATMQEKVYSIQLRATILSEYSHSAALALKAKNLKLAGSAMLSMLRTMGINPIMAGVVAITALSVGIYKIWENSTKAARAIKEMNKEVASERAVASTLFDALQKSNEGTQRRKELIDEINSKYGQYLDYQLTEKSTTEDIASALQLVNEKIQENIVLKTMQKEKEDQTAKSFEMQKNLMDEMRENSNLGQFVTDAMLKDVKRITDEGVKNGQSWTQAYSDVVSYIDSYYGARGKVDKTFWEGLQGYITETYTLAGNLDKISKSYSTFLPHKPANELEEVVVTPSTNPSAKEPGSTTKAAKDSEFKSAMDLKLKEMETAHASELSLLKKQKLENQQTEQFYNLSVISSDAVYYQKRLDTLQGFLKKAGSDKIKAEINKQIVEAQTSLLDIEQKRDNEKLSVLQDNRDKRLNIEEQSYITQKTAFEKAVAEHKISEEQSKILLLSLDTENAARRLVILQDYHDDVESLEMKGESMKVKAVEDANKAVLDADLKAARARAEQQKSLQNLVSDFKGDFGLLTLKEESKLQQKILEESYHARKDLLEKSKLDEAEKNKASTELTAAYEKAKTNIVQQSEDKRKSIRQQYGLTSMKEEYDMEMETLRKQKEQGLIEEEDYNKAKNLIKVKYLKQGFDYYKDLFSGAITALQDAELANIDAKYDAEIARAGDNTEEVARLEKEKEEKKLEVQKKYAGVQFAIKVSEIIANTAVAIMQAFAQMGPIAGAIAAVMLGATGAAQIAVANAERKKIMNMTAGGGSSGSGTGSRVATGKTTGWFDGGWSGYGSPYEVAGPVHREKYVVPAWEVKEPVAMNHIAALEAIRRQRTNANPLPDVVGFANGGYNGRSEPEYKMIADNSELVRVLSMLSLVLSGLQSQGIKAYVVYSDYQAAQATLEKSKKIGSK